MKQIEMQNNELQFFFIEVKSIKIEEHDVMLLNLLCFHRSYLFRTNVLLNTMYEDITNMINCFFLQRRVGLLTTLINNQADLYDHLYKPPYGFVQPRIRTLDVIKVLPSTF